ncbi:hypothetical protein JCM10207_008650 [Rhodosporidiobolus poonsookiae]
MSALFDGSYRLRKPSAKEEEEELKRLQAKKTRFFKRRKQEADEYADRANKLVYSGVSGIGYRDYTIGPSSSAKTRSQLDAQVFAKKRAALAEEREWDLDSDDETTSREAAPLRTLSQICRAVIVENYGEPGMFTALDSARHRQHAGPLLRVLSQSIEQDGLPFQIYLDFAARFSHDLPAKWKTYRGMCVSDTKELEVLKDINAEAVQLYAQEAALSLHSPVELALPFFLAYLDLSGDVSFGDDDVFKLKDPLSHFLAVLKLDGTAITDNGLAWIGRAAEASVRYAHLQVLSLRNLKGVTDAGVVKLVRLPLRSLDLRGTRCTDKVRRQLNDELLNSSSTSSWRSARDWPMLPCAEIERQLFGSDNFTPSRTLALLHYLGTFFNAPAAERPAAALLPFSKPLGVHLTSITRLAVPVAAPVKAEMTAEELYREHLALHAGATHAAHHRTFGAVTSTTAISRKAVEEDGHAESDRGAAFRVRNDSVAAGRFVGAGGKHGGGRASLYDVGTRKVGAGGKEGKFDRHGVRLDRDALSDSEDEDEKDAEERAKVEEAQKRWDEAAAQSRHFYQGARPEHRPPRAFAVPELSALMLVRHLPVRPPYEPLEPQEAPRRVVEGDDQVVAAAQGATLVKKKRKADDALPFAFSPAPSPPARPAVASSSFPSSSSTSSFTASQMRPAARRPKASSSSSRLSLDSPPRASASSSSPFSRTAAPAPTSSQPPPPPSNPFGKKRPPLATPRHAEKNIVRTAPVLPKRSGLAAFRGKR